MKRPHTKEKLLSYPRAVFALSPYSANPAHYAVGCTAEANESLTTRQTCDEELPQVGFHIYGILPRLPTGQSLALSTMPTYRLTFSTPSLQRSVSERFTPSLAGGHGHGPSLICRQPSHITWSCGTDLRIRLQFHTRHFRVATRDSLAGDQATMLASTILRPRRTIQSRRPAARAAPGPKSGTEFTQLSRECTQYSE